MKKALSLVLFLIMLSACTDMSVDETVSIRYLDKEISNIEISVPYVSIDGKNVDAISEIIEEFWHEYVSSFTPESEFEFDVTVDTSVENVISIKYEGEVYNLAKVIPQAFAFNFDCGSEDLLALESFITNDEIGDFLANAGDNSRNLKYAYENYCVVSNDHGHVHDFYFHNGSLYLIVTSPSGGYETIEVKSEGGEDTWTVNVDTGGHGDGSSVSYPRSNRTKEPSLCVPGQKNRPLVLLAAPLPWKSCFIPFLYRA